MNPISSLQNPLVKHLYKLRHNRDYREERGTLLVEGVKMVAEVCRLSNPKTLLVRDKDLIPSGIYPEQVFVAHNSIFEKITGSPSPEGILAEISLPKFSSLAGKKRILALDGINDPGNLGTLLRTAWGLGWEGAFLFHNCCDPFNDKALRAAKGATFYLPLRLGTWEDLKQLASSEQLPIFAADLQGQDVRAVKFPSELLLILGNEAHGLSEQARQNSQRITIPQKNLLDSLNVAVAGGILLYIMSQDPMSSA